MQDNTPPAPSPFTEQEWAALCVSICCAVKESEANPDNTVASTAAAVGIKAFQRIGVEKYLNDLMLNRLE